jgi:hypothetical protein
MHSQIARKDGWSLLDRYLGAALDALLRAARPLDIRQSTLDEAERRSTFSGRAASAHQSSVGTITASDSPASFKRLTNSAASPNCA